MILLKGHSLTSLSRFGPESMSLTLVDSGVSTASITVGPEAPELAVDNWLLDDAEPGKGIIWRVKAVDTAYETRTRTVQLEHVIAALKDALLFGEVTAKAMGGGTNVDAAKAARYVLGRQSVWTLGDFEFSKSLPYTFSNVTVFAALETICSTLDGWRWEYDLTALPFRLHVRKKSDALGCEMRSDRNLLTLKRTVDRTGMYTRFYPVGARNMRVDGDYVSRNEALYGVVSHTETDQSISKKPLLKAWAEDRLRSHAEPLVTVSISGLELSQATGEPLDHLRLGLNCRVPLPEYSTTILERVTKLAWSDKIKEPEKVTVTLANAPVDTANLIKQLSSSGSRNAGGGAKAQEEDHAWIVDTADHVGLVAEAIIGRNGDTVDWSRVSEIIVDGEGIHQRVTRTEGEIVEAWAAIEVLDDRITLEVANAKSDMYSKIVQTASSIRSEVSASKSTLFSVIMQTSTNIYIQVANAKSGMYSSIQTTASTIRLEVASSKSTLFSTIMQTSTNIYTQVGNAKSDTYSKIEQTASTIRSEVSTSNSSIYSTIEQTASTIRSEVASSKSSLWSSIQQSADAITLKVGKGEVISCINQSAEQIDIKASKINLSGYVTADELNTQKGRIDNLISGDTKATYLKASSMATDSLSVNSGGSFRFRSYTVAWKLASFKNGDGGTTEFYYLGRA